jgi:hypothetical protein
LVYNRELFPNLAGFGRAAVSRLITLKVELRNLPRRRKVEDRGKKKKNPGIEPFPKPG